MLRSAVTAFLVACAYGAPPAGPAPASLAEIDLVRLDGSAMPQSELAGKVVLFVNVASKCGKTPQYAGLQALFARYRNDGFVVVGTPCNQFFGQEPGSPEEIAEFCHTRYGVTFPILEKADVNGSNRNPLYQWLIASPAGGGEDISWNFEKFVVGRDGTVRARFAPGTVPEDPALVEAITTALAEPG